MYSKLFNFHLSLTCNINSKHYYSEVPPQTGFSSISPHTILLLEPLTKGIFTQLANIPGTYLNTNSKHRSMRGTIHSKGLV